MYLVEGLIPDGGLEAGTLERQRPLHQLSLALVKYLTKQTEQSSIHVYMHVCTCDIPLFFGLQERGPSCE